jgi:hypothetical protein
VHTKGAKRSSGLDELIDLAVRNHAGMLSSRSGIVIGKKSIDKQEKGPPKRGNK